MSEHAQVPQLHISLHLRWDDESKTVAHRRRVRLRASRLEASGQIKALDFCYLQLQTGTPIYSVAEGAKVCSLFNRSWLAHTSQHSACFSRCTYYASAEKKSPQEQPKLCCRLSQL